MSIVLLDTSTNSPGGNSYSNATRLTRLAIDTIVLSSNGDAIGSGGLLGYLLPTNPIEGDIVEIYSTDSTVFYIYADSGIPVNNSNNNFVSAQTKNIRAKYTTAGWYTF